MAKDGASGGPRVGAGRKPKALADKINQGTDATMQVIRLVQMNYRKHLNDKMKRLKR